MKIKIYLATQHLELLNDAGEVFHRYPVSTAKNGAGEIKDSGCTPRGKHVIRAKIGENYPENTVFVRRRPTGEIYSPALAAQYPQRDWILTRILWLTGCESGLNRGGNCDTLRRFIYIHGTPDSEPMDIPQSHGCIRMRHADLMAIFELVTCGTAVEIIA
jgi:lipoprotein-anchoring transpeptidase ErfK/SrfK